VSEILPNPSAVRLLLPDAPVLAAWHQGAALLSVEGEIELLSHAAARARLRQGGPPILCHAPSVARRLGVPAGFEAIDLLELFLFARPGRACAPSAKGLAAALGLEPPGDLESEPGFLLDAATALLRGLARDRELAIQGDADRIAAAMGRAGWAWAPSVLAALGRPNSVASNDAFRVWRRLPEWEETAPPPPPGSEPVTPVEARRRLAELLGPGAEDRPGQADFASAASFAFLPREAQGEPRMVLAEAGTGTGKTLGYLAPASVWAERNGAPVWISTYTRNLQRQIAGELQRLGPAGSGVVVRKGRENYLCLLNYEETLQGIGGQGRMVAALGLVARWARVTADGDLFGGDLPGWLDDLTGGRIRGLADRRGECIHSACPHWKVCFVERGIRAARHARIVVANHALVMIQAAWGMGDEGALPVRYVFDEGHHVFDAADSAFSAHLSALEGLELRRWLLGAEGARSRARGLQARIEDLVGKDEAMGSALHEALLAARALPRGDWAARLEDDPGEALADVEALAVVAQGHPFEGFLGLLRRQVLARASDAERQFALECEVEPPLPEIAEAAGRLERELGRIAEPVRRLKDGLLARIEDEAETLETDARTRIAAMARSLERRALQPLSAWRAMLRRLAPGGVADPKFVDWFAIDRRDGRAVDVGFHRHWRDPTEPFAAVVAGPAHGVLITSATLRDAGEDNPEKAWAMAEARTGTVHLPAPALRADLASPFDYGAATRALIVTDVRKDSLDQVAAAYRALFVASGGGGLGLFTAISRLRAVQARIAGPLEEAGIQLHAQHVDPLDATSLVELFRADEDSCLLGTDAMRDGVDVPGRSLRLLVFDRVPWPRPDILHRARRAGLRGDRAAERVADDRIARARLRQAFGRLVRRQGDRGVFVLLDPMTPTRLLSALPAGVEAERVGLAQAVRVVAGFLGEGSVEAGSPETLPPS